LPPSDRAVAWPYLQGSLSGPNGGVQLSPRRLLDDGLQQAELMFRNSLGEPELRLEISLPRLLYQEGKKAIRFFLGTALLVAFSALLLIYLGLERWILRRVQRMHEEVAAIGHDARQPRLSDQGSDELSQLASELNLMLERLQQSEARDRAILDSISDGYFEITPQGTLVTANRALSQILGYPSEELIGRSYQEVLGSADVERARALFAQALTEGGDTSFAAPFKRHDKSLGYFETRFSLIHDAQGRLAGYRGILRDISDQVAYQNQLIDMAYRDPLTGLGNRKAFAEQLQSSLEQAQRQRTPQALLYLDLDRFKEVNDRFGHAVGDALLVAIADRLRGALRLPDRLYRLGGDEFTLLLADAGGEAAQRLAERLLAALVAPFELAGTSIDFVTPSIGIALFPDHAQDPEALIKAADKAMYQAKRQRNRACLYDAEQHPLNQPG
ncbi:MAG: diguanylate cyclase domain-containing protein, partial [Pseudomonas sp.]